MALKLNVNGEAVAVDASGDTPLLWVLRDHLGLTGTKYGCGGGYCGACTVHVDGSATRSCQLPGGHRQLARSGCATVDMDRAGPAIAATAAVLGAGQPQVVPQHP